MKKVLIICTGNSCRSIMAEAVINHFLKGQWQAFSAGTHPSHVHPYAIKALQELGTEVQGLRSKSISEFWDSEDLDLVVTVCDSAKENCPVFHKPIPRVHMSFEDPVRYGALDFEEAMQGFRKVRADIVARLLPMLQAYEH
ncbi:MAG: arsenate reductase ArsC [Candidatus Cloacimonadaceae bacterium]|nr:arsenate reductase ArsC [Candidatus Cloacimonadota bacterium]